MSTPKPDPPRLRALSALLEQAMLADRSTLGRRLRALATRPGATPGDWEAVEKAIGVSVERVRRRRDNLPRWEYPPELPVSQHAEEIATAIQGSPAIVVCGETGSGKTTQLPKICLAAGRGVTGMIGHTQPRRIAARSVAQRIADELATPLGTAVGFKVRFADNTSPDSYIKLMTDGILLAETQGDRWLSAYDTLIIDEAHERSLNIDFLLGYAKQLLRRRPEMRLIITSATLDAGRFSRHFDNAPVIEVSGRAFPVEIRYRPLTRNEDDDEQELEDAIVDAVGALWREGPGDILVFLPGEREIRETTGLLRSDLARRPYAGEVEILPLYSRLSVPEQQRVFSRSRGRRVVLATNVAETSLTVPGVRYVVDSGLARLSRYSVRSKVRQLQIEKVSQAAANQRAGRCGRVAAGICVRLYDEADYTARPPYTDPEILRSSLAAVVLQMEALGLGQVEAFPFLEPPAPRSINDGYLLLEELGAVDSNRRITAIGRDLARLPVDPRVGRIIVAGRAEGCLAEILPIAAALSVPDPRERPLDRQGAADQAHFRFRDERSDFLAFLNLWEFFGNALGEKMSHRRLVDHCRAHFVSQLRLREWRDVHRQLVDQLAEVGWKVPGDPARKIEPALYMNIHRALLAGLLGNIGTRSEGGDPKDISYLGARGLRFYLHPGSGLARKSAKWVVSAELTETTRLYARCVGRIEPEWVEAVAGDRVRREVFEPRWDRKAGAGGEVMASERVTLYGLTLVPRRSIRLGPIDPREARQVFIREALVPGDLDTRGAFLAHNRRLQAEVAELEHKTRRQDVLVDDATLYAFYAERLPETVVSTASFEAWREEAERTDSRILFMSHEDLMRRAALEDSDTLFPGTLTVAGNRLPLKYRFSPGHPLDGLTLTVPLALLNQFDEAELGWLVPGLVREKVAALIKALPKETRNRLIPHAETITAFLGTAEPRAGPLEEALRGFLGARLGAALPAGVWDRVELPAHLRVNLQVVDEGGKELACGRDAALLRTALGQAAQLTVAAAGPDLERSGLTRWDFGELPTSLTFTRGGQRITAWPALEDEGETVAIRLFDTEYAALASHRRGVVRLLAISLRDVLRACEKPGPAFSQAALQLRSVGSADSLLADLRSAVRDRAFIGEDPLPRSEKAFDAQRTRARTRLPAVNDAAGRLLGAIATEYHALGQKIGTAQGSLAKLAGEVRRQRDALVYPGFLAATPWEHLNDLSRYLQALSRRLAKFAERPDRDARHSAAVQSLWSRWSGRFEAERRQGRVEPALAEYRWMLEELRVSLFAQELKTPYPVSFKRLEKAWSDLEACRR